MGNIEISVVIPAYNEERNIGILYDRLKIVLENLKKRQSEGQSEDNSKIKDYEIIFVDDGSTDRTPIALKNIYKKDRKHVKVIRLRKNFGQTAAMDAGFRHAKGNIIIAMDADLQNDPADIPRLVEKINCGYDLVSGWRYKRKDPFFKKIMSGFANRLRRILTGEKIHDSGCSLKAYRKKCLEGLELYGEMHRFIPAILMWKGYKVGEIKVRHLPRRFGKTKYGITRIIKGFFDLMVVVFWQRYSARPIHLFGIIGLLSTAFGVLCGLLSLYLKIFKGQDLSNTFLPTLAVLSVILGVQFFVSGILADVSIKNYYKNTPAYNIEVLLDDKRRKG